MPFLKPEIKTIYNRIMVDIESRITGKSTILPIALLRIIAIAFSGAIHILYRYLAWLGNQIMVVTAETDWLVKHGAMWGVVKRAPEYATGVVRFTGVDSSPIPTDTILESSVGFQYKTIASVVITSGFVDVGVIATEAGAEYNLYKESVGEVLELVLLSPIENVTDEAVLQNSGEITGGFDVEDDETFRLRILERIQQTPAGGTKYDYIRWAKEVTGVVGAWCFPSYLGAGTVIVVISPPSSGLLIDVKAHIDTKKPVTANSAISGTNYVQPVDIVPISFTLSITPDNTELRLLIAENIENLFKKNGEPGGVIFLSHIRSTISSSGVYDYKITQITKNTVVVPIADIEFVDFEYPKLSGINY